MSEPSAYELDAWHAIQRYRGRPLSRAVRGVGSQLAAGAIRAANRATEAVEKRPKAQAAVERGRKAAERSAQIVSVGARKSIDALPAEMRDWSGAALVSVSRMVARTSRAGLTEERILARHRKRGHNLRSLLDMRRLDLEHIDAVRGRGASLYYPAAAALSGAGSAFLISGGQLATAASAGAAAAPSAAVVAGAFVGDAAFVLGLASRAVGHVSLMYGFDPEDPGEKLFVMSVINAGTALSATAKTAALADISRLTQALIRGKVWAILDRSVVTQVSKQFAKAFSVRLTKQSLGKFVPLAGIVVGGGFNWATLESIVDAADIAYRRRFLLEKYPFLAEHTTSDAVIDPAPEDADEMISVLDELAELGGPKLTDDWPEEPQSA